MGYDDLVTLLWLYGDFIVKKKHIKSFKSHMSH